MVNDVMGVVTRSTMSQHVQNVRGRHGRDNYPDNWSSKLGILILKDGSTSRTQSRSTLYTSNRTFQLRNVSHAV